jgi:putative ABC transport system ATP-binding protein
MIQEKIIVLEAIDVTKTYEFEENEELSVTAVDHVSLEIEKNEFVAIVGASGSGKSTLLRILGLIDKPSFGNVVVDGTNVTQNEIKAIDKLDGSEAAKVSDKLLSQYRREKIGFVFQDFNLIPVLTVRENIELPIRLCKRKVDKVFINDLLDTFGLAECAHQYPGKISGGQQQRTAVVRALANKPSIILADEPTGNLDSKNSALVMDYMMKCIGLFDQTVVVVTHDAKIAALADRVIEISDGKLVDLSLTKIQ